MEDAPIPASSNQQKDKSLSAQFQRSKNQNLEEYYNSVDLQHMEPFFTNNISTADSSNSVFYKDEPSSSRAEVLDNLDQETSLFNASHFSKLDPPEVYEMQQFLSKNTPLPEITKYTLETQETLQLVPQNADRLSDSDVDSLNSQQKYSFDIEPVELPQSPTVKSPEKNLLDRAMILEVVTVLTISVIGSVTAGYTFNRISTIDSFRKAPGLFMLIPILFNLKGNIETNLATRLATLANTGYFSIPRRRNAEIKACLSLLLFQSFIVSATASFLVSCLIPIIAMDDTLPSDLSWGFQSLILIFTSMASTILGSAIVGSLASLVVIMCVKLGINSDNVSAPIVASFGDLLTLIFVSYFSTAALTISPLYTVPCIFLFFFVGYYMLNVVRNDPLVSPFLGQGWSALIYAFVTSSISGVLLERYVSNYPLLAGISPVFNGSSQNVATIFASRLSTDLHAGLVDPEIQLKTSFILLSSNIPVQLLFIIILCLYILTGITGFPMALFSLLYLVGSSFHVSILLIVGSIVAKVTWSLDKDPDFYVNPIISGTGDMLGTIFLVLIFKVAVG